MITNNATPFSVRRDRAHTFSPQYAVCIHSNGADVLATAHTPKSDGTLGTGKIVAMDDINRVIQSLNVEEKKTDVQWANPNVLLDTPKWLVWSIPPQGKTLWFRISETESVNAIIPRTVFVVNRKRRVMHVFAAQAKRLTPDTPLYHAPYMNVNSQGFLCQGNAQLPDDLSVTNDKTMVACENSLFDSIFTHNNHDGTWKTKKDNGISNQQHIVHWKKVTKENRAPRMSELNSTKHTLRELLKKLEQGGFHAI